MMSETVIETQSLELTYSDAKYFKEILKALAIFKDEIQFTISYEGLNCQFMDPSHVSMMILDLPRTTFDTLLVAGPRTIRINLEDVVKKIFRNVYSDDAVKLIIDSNKAIFSLWGSLKRDFKAPLLENVDEELPVPKVEHKAKVKLAIKALDRILKDADNLSEHLTLTVRENSISFDANGNSGVTEYHVTIDQSNENMLHVSNLGQGPQKATFSMSYLTDFVKALKQLTDVVEISLSTDIPMKISADLGYRGTITFWLAPRIDTED